MKLIDVERALPVPWRNGGGVTRELWVWPSVSDGQLRISVADITQEGLFSAFPGVGRWFTVLEGEGVVLEFAHSTRALGPDDAPLRLQVAAADALDLPAWTLAIHPSAAGQAWAVCGHAPRAWWLAFEPEGTMQL